MAAPSKIIAPLEQKKRPKCSLPLLDADLTLGNANWSRGLQSMSEWIWSGHLNPAPFPSNLARFFLHIPGIFEQQLNFSTTLVFDEPSFKNGVQITGFLNRVVRELAINLIAQRRLCWYTMTHHAILGYFTAQKHGLSKSEYIEKWVNLTEYNNRASSYSRVERAVLSFTDAFTANPKNFTDEQFQELKEALKEDNQKRYAKESLWLARCQAARVQRARALLKNNPQDEGVDRASRRAAEETSPMLPSELNETKVNAQLVELAFLCLQFTALSAVFTGLNIPDEDFLSDLMVQQLPPPVIEHINKLNQLGLERNIPTLVPPAASENPNDLNVGGELFEAIVKGSLKVESALLKGARIPLTPYEGRDRSGNFRPAFTGAPDADNGLTVGGIQTGVYGWSFGGHFPGSLPYCLMNHPELSRYEAPYSLPLLFNEDEWRNGVQTGGYLSRRIKELAIQKTYRINRCRYGIEHHTMYLYNTYLDEHGVGRGPTPNFSESERAVAREKALLRAQRAALYVHDHTQAPFEVFTSFEKAALSWVEALIRTPHTACQQEGEFRSELIKENRREIQAGIRHLDISPAMDEEAALKRLVEHQVAELAMATGHMDGLARTMIMLRLEAEEGVQMIEGRTGPSGGIVPNHDPDGQAVFTGYFNNRPGIHEVLSLIGVDQKVLTLNELILNPPLCKKIKKRLQQGEKSIEISQQETNLTGEF